LGTAQEGVGGMSVCNCQECEQRREPPQAMWLEVAGPVPTNVYAPRRVYAERVLRRLDGTVIASGSPEFIAAVARWL